MPVEKKHLILTRRQSISKSQRDQGEEGTKKTKGDGRIFQSPYFWKLRGGEQY